MKDSIDIYTAVVAHLKGHRKIMLVRPVVWLGELHGVEFKNNRFEDKNRTSLILPGLSYQSEMKMSIKRRELLP